MRVLAVDWSGDAHLGRKHIWLAEAIEPGRLVRLEAGRDRLELLEHLSKELDPHTIIGFDFAFS